MIFLSNLHQQSTKAFTNFPVYLIVLKNIIICELICLFFVSELKMICVRLHRTSKLLTAWKLLVFFHLSFEWGSRLFPHSLSGEGGGEKEVFYILLVAFLVLPIVAHRDSQRWEHKRMEARHCKRLHIFIEVYFVQQSYLQQNSLDVPEGRLSRHSLVVLTIQKRVKRASKERETLPGLGLCRHRTECWPSDDHRLSVLSEAYYT
jgi:hypothetical protein